MGKKNRGAPAQKGEAQSSAFGNGAGSPQNGKKEGWPLWSPQKIYWLLDDLVYNAVETCYEKLNNLAGKLGKKKPIARGVAATLAVAIGNAPSLMMTPKLDGFGTNGTIWSHELGFRPDLLPGYAFIVCAAALGAAAMHIAGNAGEKLDGVKPVSELLCFPLRVARLPVVAAAVAVTIGALLSENVAKGLSEAGIFAGTGAYLYLLSNSNGTGKKVKEALGKLMENLQAGLAQEDPVPVEKRKRQ
jgi:hypothetical protein